MNAFAVELKNLNKKFGAVHANQDVSLKIHGGSIHGIIGENGAGKSTTMKMLYGLYQPDSGEIYLNGQLKSWSSAADAVRAGIGMVHQHFMLAGPETVLDNIILSTSAQFLGFEWSDRKLAREKLTELLKTYRWEINLDAHVENLPVGIQQKIEILKLIYQNNKILILDEPTAVLTPPEILDFFETLKIFKKEGRTIVIITHKLKEVMAITDRVTVFRGGKVTGQVETSETSITELAHLMVGREVDLTGEAYPRFKKLPDHSEALEIKNLTLQKKLEKKPKLKDLNLTVHSGEIVGVAGVEGNGQSELIQAILHPNDSDFSMTGKMCIAGIPTHQKNSLDIRKLGVGYIAEDRHKEGLLLRSNLMSNYLLGQSFRERFYYFGQTCLKFLGILNFKRVKDETVKAIRDFEIRPDIPEVSAGSLSGGNQQKLIVARELEHPDLKLLIAAQPTRGVDIGAIEIIHKNIVQAKLKGSGVLLVSSELDEILALSDRIVVIFEGTIVGEYLRSQIDDGSVNEKDIGIKMGGGK